MHCRCMNLDKSCANYHYVDCEIYVGKNKVVNYIQRIQELLDAELNMKGTEYEGLLGVYALLVFTVGKNCTNEHIHDAWSIWQSKTEPEHRSLVPFGDLTEEVQNLDIPYRDAVIKVAKAS